MPDSKSYKEAARTRAGMMVTVDPEDDLRERMLRQMEAEGINPQDVHLNPWGANTACGKLVYPYMSTTTDEGSVTCSACRATFVHDII